MIWPCFARHGAQPKSAGFIKERRERTHTHRDARRRRERRGMNFQTQKKKKHQSRRRERPGGGMISNATEKEEKRKTKIEECQIIGQKAEAKKTKHMVLKSLPLVLARFSLFPRPSSLLSQELSWRAPYTKPYGLTKYTHPLCPYRDPDECNVFRTFGVFISL